MVPLRHLLEPTLASLELLSDSAQVPMWIPWPLPSGWVVTGFADAGDERSGALATVVALSGPAPLGGVGDLAIVAEEPGIGLACRLAGMAGADPGDGFDSGAPDGKVRHDGHDIALWSIDAGAQYAVYVGEAMANWLWFVFSPADTGVLMCEITAVRDLSDRHDGDVAMEPPFGALSPFLTEALRPRQ
ncbi:hypothetical protein GCM10022402_21170 [Salinactinospora qingdaonensis]|uniref:Uncharacterized protein n=1 Tax=Salinactinospora qingdaonensis TaxID=702744 RepID=A0ABP7FJ23_9ACTN